MSYWNKLDDTCECIVIAFPRPQPKDKDWRSMDDLPDMELTTRPFFSALLAILFARGVY